MKTTQARPKLWTFSFISLCLISLFIYTSSNFNTNATTLLVSNLGGAASFSGMLVIFCNGAAALTRIFSGRLTDLKGRRVMMLFGTLSFALSTGVCALVNTIWLLIPLRIVQGIGYSATTTAAAAAATDVLPKERLGEGIGYFGQGLTLSLAFGPSLGIFLINIGGFSLSFTVSAALILLAFACALVYRDNFKLAAPSTAPDADVPSAAEEKQNLLSKLFEKAALKPAICMTLTNFSIASILTFLTLFAEYRGFPNAGLFFTVSAAPMIIGRILMGRWVDRIHHFKLVIPCFISGIIMALLLAFAKSNILFLATGVLFGLVAGGVLPVFNTLAMRDIPAHRRGAASSTFSLGMDIGVGGGSLIWGAVIDLFANFSGDKYTVVFLLVGVVMLISLITTLILLRDKPAKN